MTQLTHDLLTDRSITGVGSIMTNNSLELDGKPRTGHRGPGASARPSPNGCWTPGPPWWRRPLGHPGYTGRRQVRARRPAQARGAGARRWPTPALEQLGGLDILIDNAGAGPDPHRRRARHPGRGVAGRPGHSTSWPPSGWTPRCCAPARTGRRVIHISSALTLDRRAVPALRLGQGSAGHYSRGLALEQAPHGVPGQHHQPGNVASPAPTWSATTSPPRPGGPVGPGGQRPTGPGGVPTTSRSWSASWSPIARPGSPVGTSSSTGGQFPPRLTGRRRLT